MKDRGVRSTVVAIAAGAIAALLSRAGFHVQVRALAVGLCFVVLGHLIWTALEGEE